MTKAVLHALKKRDIEFQVNTGVRQGCLMSSTLYIIAIGWYERHIYHRVVVSMALPCNVTVATDSINRVTLAVLLETLTGLTKLSCCQLL